MDKILLLGGSEAQVISITTAKKLGYYTILCDYLPDNPGQYVADKFYPVSTTDKEAILNIAKRENVDGVLAYASDPATPTAAFVAEKLGLATNPYKSVQILSDKGLFREFLKKNGFNTPFAKVFNNFAEVADVKKEFKLPVIIKPVDSSGSKGVSKIENWNSIKSSFDNAIAFSGLKRVIIEEYVEKYGYQINGDGLVIDGKLIFTYFGHQHYNNNKCCQNPHAPISTSFPYLMSDKMHSDINIELQRIVTLLGMKSSCYNIEIRKDRNGKIFIMEIAPRCGGNYIPQVIKNATGLDMVECAIKAAMNKKICVDSVHGSGYWSYYVIHSLKDGILENIEFSEKARSKIKDVYMIKKQGDKVEQFSNASTILGRLIMKFDSSDEMIEMMEHSDRWINIVLK